MKYGWIILLCLASASRGAQTYFYVATNGVDTNPGTIGQPFGTIEAGQTAARSASPATVFLRGGTYYRTNVLLLNASDNGNTFKAYTNESVTLSGALPVTNFVAVSGAVTSRLTASQRANVLMSDISNLGVSDYGSLTNRGSNAIYGEYRRPWMVELFFDDQRQQLARWPNQDKSQEVWAFTKSPVADASHGWFTYYGSNPSGWALTETAWVHGMWTYWWADSYLQVASVGASSNAILTTTPALDYGFLAGQPYEALNVLEELDVPGEWVIDRAGNKLYFWPPSTNANQRTALSILATDFIDLTNAANVQLWNLIFDAGRASGVSMRYSTNILIAGCTFQNLGNMGVLIGNSANTNTADQLPTGYDYQGGLSNTVAGCYLHDLGEGGIVLSGGDRPSLTPSGHLATNNYIHDFNTNIRCYRPAVRIDGVGNTLSHAVIHDSPHHAIWFSGNDNLIEYCNIYRVCKDTDDAGTIYCVARDWKQQGTVIRYNLLQPSRGNGIYLDDFTTGVSMYGNTIVDTAYAFLVGGGRANAISNNLVIGFNNSVGWTVSNRGATWATNSLPALITSLQSVPYTNAPYSKYAEMPVFLADISNYLAHPSVQSFTNVGIAKDNAIVTNIMVSANPYVLDIDTNIIALTGTKYFDQFSGFTNFVSIPTLNAVVSRNFALTNYSWLHFQQVPNNMGVTNDAYGVVTTNLIPAYPATLARAPFQTLTIPGVIHVYDYDDGPVAYTFSTNATASTYNSNLQDYGNNAWGSGRYRLESPFYIWGTVTNGARVYVMDIDPSSSWLEYTVSVAKSGAYTLALNYQYVNASFHLSMDGSPITPVITSANASSLFPMTLSSGTHTIRLENESNSGTQVNRLGFMDFESSPSLSTTSLTIGKAIFGP